jgi:hypothetical protein
VTVTVRGADTLARTLSTFAGDLGHLTAAHTAAGNAVIGKARPRTRRRTGALAASWRALVTVDGSRIGSHLPYAAVQEYGSPARHITPSRALTTGLADATDDVERIYFRAVDTAIGKVRGA